MKPTDEQWHRRHAVQLASQLPEDPHDAREILRLTLLLFGTFLTPAPPKASASMPDNVTTLRK